MTRLISAGLVFAVLATPVLARDLNRQNYLIGERASGMGGAFVSMVGDATSSYYNPAGLAGLSRRGISLSASAYQASLETYRRLLDLDVGGGDSITSDMKSFTFSTFPASMVYLLPLDDNQEQEAFHHVLAFSVLVPDYDKMLAEIDQPIGDYAFELKGSFLNEEMTYWAGPSYAVALGRLRLGLSLFVLAHLAENRSKLGLKLSVDDGAGGTLNAYSSGSMERSAMCLTMLAQAGVHLDLGDHLTLGFTLRSPTFGSLYSKVSILEFNSSYLEDMEGNPMVTAENPGYVDRIETKEDVSMNYRLPLMMALGVSYHRQNSFAIALDVSLHLPQDPYNLFEGPRVYPQDPMGNDITDDERALDPDERRSSTMLINANLGAEIAFTESILGRFGVFTNFSVVDQDYYDRDLERRLDALTLPRLQRVGLSAGLGMIGEKSTTSFGVVYVAGVGESFSLDEVFGSPRPLIDVVAHTITVVLAGSADL